MGKVLLSAKERYPGVELVASIADSKTKTKEKEPSEVGKKGASKDEMIATVLEIVKEALQIVDAKATPAEAQAYRKLTYDVAKAAAEATGSGIFGFGAKISDDEAAYLKKLEAVVG